jgi:hypothetical protein
MATKAADRSAGVDPMTIWVVISAILIPLIISEFSEVSPWMAKRLLAWGARRMPTTSLAERYQEEWLAGIDEFPGRITKLAKAIGIVLYMIPAMNWRANRAVYLWPTRKVVYGLLSMVAPAQREKRWSRRVRNYAIYVGAPAGEKEATFSDARLLTSFLQEVSTHPGPFRFFPPRVQTAINGELVAHFDHRKERFLIFKESYTNFHAFRVGEIINRGRNSVAFILPQGYTPGERTVIRRPK